MNKLKLFALAVVALFTGGAMAVELARFEIPANQDLTKAVASYETDNATITVNKVGGSSSNWYTSSNNVNYAKLTSNDAYITIALKNGDAFAAGHKVTIAVINSSQKSGLGFFIKSTTGNKVTADMSQAGVEATNTYILTADDINEDGSLTFYRVSSNTFVNRIIVEGEMAQITEPIVKSYTIAGVKAIVDQESKTITAELPYGTDKTTAIDAATIVLGGTATSSSYNTEKTTLTVTDGTSSVTYTLNITIGAFKCGEIIKAVHSGSTTATVTGSIGGSVDKNTQSSGKLGSNNHYFGIKLANGTFQPGDVVTINLTVISTTLELFSDKGTTMIDSKTEGVVVGENSFILSQPTEWIYLYRTVAAGSNMNPTVDYISVTRACEAGVSAFKIAGVEAVIDQENKTITAELPYGTVLTDEDWNNAYTLQGPATSATYNESHTTLTVEDVVYTLNITIATEQSSDNTLKSLSVNGNAITLVAEQFAYTYVLPYGTTETPVVAAEANDVSAIIAITQIESVTGTALVAVTAANGDVATYTVEISVADAPKFLTEVVFSNGAKGAINVEEAKVSVPYLAGTEEPTIVGTPTTEGEGTSVIVNEDGTITLKGIDAKETIYTVEKIALTPASDLGTEVVTFGGTENYIFAPYGWDASKGWKFAKNVEEAGNRRISKGNTRIYIALPAAKSVILTSGTGGNRDIKVYVNGVENVSVTSTGASGETKEIALSADAANFVAIESNQTKGDGGFIALQIVPDSGTSLINAEAAEQAQKVMVGGQLMIIKNGVMYNAQGAIVK
ncbi:MAG: hypothetical protein ACI30A_01085 [Paludibacteraceae bacterium]